MRLIKKLSFLVCTLMGIGLFVGCEKDDICIAGDTPKMRISFFSALDETTEKAPPQLLVVGKDQNTPVPTLSPGSSSVTEGLIPLKPNASETELYMVTNASIDSEGVVSGNIDTLIITYNASPKFISKACGFIVNYENLIPVLTPDSDNWIKRIEVITPTINNETDLHVKIYH
ncbi:MAG: DUF6452 family protein [Flavobacteriia bacterium]|nr:DUF6452 family protein [Flavobacteriia bacterium]